MTSQADIRKSIIEQSDQCVLCGLCLEHCPTYQLTLNEAESPRGRISLLRALATGELSVDRKFSQHIDQCTGCLRCETACPAKVNYSSIIDKGRALKRLFEPASKRIVQTAILTTLRYRFSTKLSRQLNIAASRLSIKNSLPIEPVKSIPQDSMEPRSAAESVTLFSGCTGQELDRATVDASRQLLAKLNIQTVLAKQHLCCGATFQHAGAPQLANRLLKNTIQVTDRLDHYPLVSIATGCAAQLHKYAREFSTRDDYQHFNIVDYLLTLSWPEHIKVKHYPLRVFLHTPCTTEQAASEASAAITLLRKIPDLDLVVCEPHYGCCGAGGLNLLTQTELGEKLVAPIIDQVLDSGSEIVLTSNIGCQLQLRRALRQRNQSLAVMHPITLLNQQSDYA